MNLMPRPVERILPAEILGMIFADGDDGIPVLNPIQSRTMDNYYRGRDLAHGTSDIQYETSYKPVAAVASMVCKHWKDVIDGDGTLLSTTVRWFERRNPYIKRSIEGLFRHLDINTGSELFITCGYPYIWSRIDPGIGSTFTHLMKPLFQKYSRRIVAFEVGFGEYRTYTAFLEIFNSQSLPRLQRLGCRKLTYVRDGEVIPKDVTLLRPPLSHVTVLSIDIHPLTAGWGELFGASLTTLRAIFDQAKRGDEAVWNKFIEDLARCPNVENMTLQAANAGLPLISQTPPDKHRVALPKLRSMTFKSREYYYAAEPFWWFFSWVDVPQMETLSVHGWYLAPEFIESLEELRTGLVKYSFPLMSSFASPTSNVMTTLFLGHAQLPKMRRIFLGDTASPTYPRPTDQIWFIHFPQVEVLTLNFETMAPRAIIKDILGSQTELTHLRLSSHVMNSHKTASYNNLAAQVRKLTIDKPTGLRGDISYCWLKMMPALETLVLPFCEVDGSDLFGFLETMHRCVVPDLKHLILVFQHHINFERRRFGKKFGEKLAGWVRARKNWGNPISTLTLTREPTPTAFAELKIAVPGVEILISEKALREHNATYLDF